MDVIKISLQRPIFISMLTLFLVAVGLISLSRLPVDLYPDVSYPVLAVRADLSGAAPEEVEQLVTKRLEDALSTLAGIKSMRSVSREGMAMVILEFDSGIDVRFEEIQARAKIANMRNSLPEEMGEPTVFRRDPDDSPIIELAITGQRAASELGKLVEDEIAMRLRQIPGVGEVDLQGERTEEITIELNPLKLEFWKIKAQDIVAAIKANNRNDPVGKLEGSQRVWVLRSLSQAKSAYELGNIVVANSSDGMPIFLRDVAEIKQGFAEQAMVTRTGNSQQSGPAILLNVLKQSGVNTLEVSKSVRTVLDKLKGELPADLQISIMRDNADLVRSNVADVNESLVIGAALTILVVLVFLGSLRSTLTTGLALPSSIITTFAIMAYCGFTINVMTLLALSLAVGLLVDDAIVVRENIFRHLQSKKMNPVDAAHQGSKEVILAVLATTLTIVAVFLPVGFMGGLSGQFFKQFALTVVFAVLVSTWDTLTMAPMLSAYFANIADPRQEWLAFGRMGAFCSDCLTRFEHSFDWLVLKYKNILGLLLPRPWIAGLVSLIALLTAVAGFVHVKKSFLPTQLGDVFSVSLNGPLAVPLAPIEESATWVEKKLQKIDSLEGWTLRFGPGSGGSAQISLTIRVKPEYSLNQDSLDAVRKDVRKSLESLSGYSLRIAEPADPLAGSSGRFQPLAVTISGREISTIRDIARQVRQILQNTDGIADVGAIDDEGLPEVRIINDPNLSAYYQVSPAYLGETLKLWVEGNNSNSLKLGSEQIPIRVRMAAADKFSPQQLLAQNIPPGKVGKLSDTPVPLGNIVRWESGAGPTVIVRENRERTMRVGAGLERGAALGELIETLAEKFAGLSLPNSYRLKIVGQSEQMNELFSNVTLAIVLGLIFVFMILASLFESFLQPLTVMAAIPLAATGAILALIATDFHLDLYAGIGLILLAGIVAKNSILLVDFAMQRVRNNNEDPLSAVLESAPLRLRPILMTSVAMIAGMLPVATGWGAGGAARMGLGITTIGGIISSTFLTLLIVPNLFVVVEKFATWFRRKKKAI